MKLYYDTRPTKSQAIVNIFSTDLCPVRHSKDSTRHTFLHKDKPTYPGRTGLPTLTYNICVVKVTLFLYHMKHHAINMHQFVEG